MSLPKICLYSQSTNVDKKFVFTDFFEASADEISSLKSLIFSVKCFMFFDPELERQVKEHKAFTEKINDFKLDISSAEASKKSLNELLVYIVNWLYKHILGSDIMIGRLSSSDNETENTNPFAFTDKYKTDIALIDDEHKHLFEVIEQTNELIHANLLHDKYDEIIHLLNELKTYTETHFSDEEALMKNILSRT